MDLKTNVGIRISINTFNGSKFLLFNKPVRSLELSKTEARKLGCTLLSNTSRGTTDHLRLLIEKKFFGQPRSLAEIKSILFQDGLDVKITSLHMLLTKMVNRGELKRQGRKWSYRYTV